MRCYLIVHTAFAVLNGWGDVLRSPRVVQREQQKNPMPALIACPARTEPTFRKVLNVIWSQKRQQQQPSESNKTCAEDPLVLLRKKKKKRRSIFNLVPSSPVAALLKVKSQDPHRAT